MPPDGADNVQPEWGAKQRRKCCDQPTEQSPETQSDPNLTARQLNPGAPLDDLSETRGAYSPAVSAATGACWADRAR